MKNNGSKPCDELVESLLDLKHDLGKYIRLPFSLLPRQASHEDVASAAETALRKTRSDATGQIRTARQIWNSFLKESGPAASRYHRFGRLSRTVDLALGWEDRVEMLATGTLERSAVERDLQAVGEAIQDFLDEVKRG